MRYDLAWSEVWADLKPVVAGALSGHVVHVDNAQMFLNRGNFLEGESRTSPDEGQFVVQSWTDADHARSQKPTSRGL